MLPMEDPKENFVLTGWDTAYVGSYASAKRWRPISRCLKRTLQNLLQLELLVPHTVTSRRQDKSWSGLPGASGTVKRNLVLHMPNVNLNLVSVSSVGVNDLTVLFTKKKNGRKMENQIGGGGKRICGIYAVKLKQYINDPVLERRKDILDIGHGKHKQTDRWKIKWTKENGTVQNMHTTTKCSISAHCPTVLKEKWLIL